MAFSQFPMREFLQHLVDTGGPHTTADTHGDDTSFQLPSLHHIQQLSAQLRTGASQGVTNRDCAAIRVVIACPVSFGKSQFFAGVESLRSKGLVDLKKINIVRV